ncbi:MAG: NPCBM/NEW2 domain-containing protein [Pirellula sp.]|jgi:putative membrane-bound dehydrogenase-like protein|nr:NPCBM/NEW2 domain-containing protein [Pirellula sp.]
MASPKHPSLLCLALLGFVWTLTESGRGTETSQPTPAAGPKKIVFIAGGPSHDFGSHEHYAGCRILADVIKRTVPDIQCDVVRNGWPSDDALLDSADTIVIYSDGGGGHPSLAHLPRLQKQMDRGAGLVCLHYAVEVPKDRGGPEFLQWLGGYFETHWSVNPHWTAKFASLPKHPVTTGVKPFETRDEWYFHMRFREGMQGVTPILSAIAPETTMDRPDGPHSGNPDVRRAVANKEPQHVAWASERKNGGRAFGYTGGHFHWNWGRTEPTRLVANAILWTAHIDIPESGALVEPIEVVKLVENQDEPTPPNFNPAGVAKEFGIPPGAPVGLKNPGKLLFSSKTLTSQTSRHRIDVDVDVKGVKKLFLIVTPGDDGFSCDWADWIAPTLIDANGQRSLLDLPWFTATSEWGAVRKNANAGGGPLKVYGETVEGIGTHATSVIGFELPEGCQRFQVGCGLDEGGVSQNGGSTTSVRFHIAAEGVPAGLNAWGQSGEDRTPENAVAGLKVADGVEATLAASEPVLKSLTNLDIDHRGRVWVCEVVNYRRHNGERPEGDRILILEDTDQDGVMDQSKVFYQGRDIDSAIGLCVLGNRVLVSASPYVFEFIDENGDDIPDSKRAILTKTGDPQHDHSVHSFVFGPDGKLYFNFGNTGHRLCDTNGEPIRDRWGRVIDDSGKPYRQGMVFRCNEDLSDMEVLGHNFRNNYEVSVDSFGALWQSDNDDDGNRATRINFVMEFGNYGYVDEVTGAGWQAERTNWEKEIPERHWHLNDPGVVPTMLITGAGSPTGITVYEGDLLPEKFRNQVIHCDAGPNVVRAYVASNDGAGYRAQIEDLAVGEYDRWFRPADVAVAPDGSLFVTDWYDPGVGGHNMQDMERGRLFRLAPPGSKYVVPKFDFSNPEGAVTALSNPSSSVRYMAFKSLLGMGDRSVPALKRMAQNTSPRLRARAFWLLARVSDPAQVVQTASADREADVRAAAIRIARQAKLPTEAYVPTLLSDVSPVVLRELAIALREDTSAAMPGYWVKLAQRFDGRDRWYLEALGIAATDRWDECLSAYRKTVPMDPSSAAQRMIAWRGRGPVAAELQSAWLQSDKLRDQDLLAHFRAVDFLSKDDRKKALMPLLDMEGSPDRVIEALMRLEGVDLEGNPRLAQVVRDYIERMGNDPKQLKILQRLRLAGFADRLLERAAAWGPSTQAVQAIDMALETGGADVLWKWLSASEPSDAAQALSKTLSLSNRREAAELQRRLLETESVSKSIRVESAVGLARNKANHASLIDYARANRLPNEARALVGSALRASEVEELRKAAEELFPVLKSSQNPLPPIDVLVKKQGNVENGRKVYLGAATCSQCHMIGKEGQNVGPSLTEIGDKLTREAMYVSILSPSAGISHNYEAYTARNTDGEVVTGLLVSKTEAGVTIKDAKGIERTILAADLEEFKKQEKSLMPENLQETMSESDLVDLVEYLTTLRK